MASLKDKGVNSITFLYDSEFAAGLSQALWFSCLPGCQALGSIIHNLSATISIDIPISFHHVKSHDGHPLNEMADSLCTAISVHNYPCSVPVVPVDLTASMEPLKWLFVHAMSPAQRAQYHDIFINSHYAYSNIVQPYWYFMSAENIAGSIDMTCHRTSCRSSVSFDLHTVSYNVQNIRSKTIRQSLLRQLALDNVHVAGLQETKLFNQGVLDESPFVLCSSPSDGHTGFGCALVFNTSLPIGKVDGSVVRYRHDDFMILFSDPRRIIVCATCKIHTCVFLSFHAPHSGKIHDARAWWDESEKIVSKAMSSVPNGTPT
eukprot:2674662-Karenia_brevis.AAC.1